MSHFIPNSFQIPNAFVDEVMGRISGNAVKCYLLVARKTTGWQKESDFISTSQFMALTKIKDKRTVYAVIKELEEIGLIRTLKEGGRVTEFYLEKSLPVAKNDTGGRKKQNNSVDKVVAENDTGYLDSDDDKCNQSQNMSLVAENVTTLVAKNAPGTSSKKCYPTKYNINTNINNNPPISPLGDVLAYLNGA